MSSNESKNPVTEPVLSDNYNLNLRVSDLGGIEEFETSLSPGITLLSGANATNRSSFLKAFATALGGDNATVRGSQDSGEVELSVGDQVFRRTVTADQRISGDAPVPDATKYAPFTWLLPGNSIREAFRTDGDLRQIILQPVDLAQLESDIRKLQRQKRDLDQEISELEDAGRRRSDLQVQLEETKEKLDRKTQEKEEIEAELADLDEQLGDAQSDLRDQLEEARADLEEARSDRDSTIENLEQLREDLDASKDQKGELEEALEELQEKTGSYDDDFDELRGRRRELEDEISELEYVQNEILEIRELIGQILDRDRDGLDIWNELRSDEGDHITDQLDSEEVSIQCFACGQPASSTDLQDQYEFWGDRLDGVKAEIRDLRSESGELQESIDSREQLQEDIQRTKREIRRVETQIEGDQDTIERVEEQIDEKEARVDDLEETVAGIEEKLTGDLVQQEAELRDRLSNVNQKIGSLRRSRDSTEEQLEGIGDVDSQLETAQNTREEVTEELQEKRTRLQEIEKSVVEEFNERIEELLSILQYENIESIRVERRGSDVGSESKMVGEDADIQYDVELVRTDEEGVAYRSDLSSLSESEREVTAITFAIAGYLAHDINNQLPVMVFDGVEMIDADRLDRLLAYVDSVSNYTVAAVLKEDAEAIAAGTDIDVVDFSD